MRRTTVAVASRLEARICQYTIAAAPHAARPRRSICSACRRSLADRSTTPSTQCRQFANFPARSSESLAPQTHYEFFPQSLPSGPPPRGAFSIDLRQLRKEFLQLQAKAHPDRHPGNAKNKAEALSARINEAYKTLQDPLLRAQYLLSLRGVDVAEDESAKLGDEDEDLLMEVLDTRESIEAAESEEELRDLKHVNDQRVEQSVKVLEQAFRDDEIALAKEEAVRLRYWINIKESLDGWEKGKPVVLVH
ncbi:Fe-S protein assembly co-chaperone HscB [Cryomyces antarcticus]|uniref:Molecular chaperone n=1 Tax=Cryomyces antarcticus TaxID=329879 RepID=A0ABR0LRG6_9PEZI|nr:molecular chaperone [Cryomyces antarcticus]KAK5201729.1 molecular chaperone [Cryomyces antarcticus]